jgi:hypothetical protein
MIQEIEYNGYIFQIDPEQPRMRFKGGGSVKAPKPQAATPTPQGVDPEVEQKAKDKRRQRINAAGRAGTILTDTSQGLQSGTATLLGRSN